MLEPKMTHTAVFVERLSEALGGVDPFQVEERPSSGEVTISVSSGETVDLVQLQAVARVLGTNDVHIAVRSGYDDASIEIRARKVAYPSDGGCGCWWCTQHAKSSEYKTST